MKRPRPCPRLGALCLALLAGLALTPATEAVGETPWFGGSVKTLDLYGESAPAGTLPDYWISSNRLRLETLWDAAPTWQFEGALDYQLLWTDPAGFISPPGEGINRHLDLDRNWHHSADWAGRLQVDRLNLNWRRGRIDAAVGRQAIGFGRIVIFSPLDVVAPFAPDAIDTDVRPGVDALRASVHYGLDGQLGGILVWSDEDRHNSYLTTWSDNRSGIDLLGIAGQLRSRPMLGFGLAGSFGTLGLKGEISCYKGERTSRPDGDLHDRFAIGAIEAWYRFDNGITLITQYLYNGPGEDDPENYPAAALSAPLQEGLTYLLGRHYLMAAPSYELHPLITLQGLLIWNLEDDSALIRPSLVGDLSDNLVLELFWTGYTGASPKRVSPLLPPVPASEFGQLGNNGGIFLKYFF